MLKRKNGRLLLALLVITGLAGTIHDSSLTMKERKFAISHLKSSREQVLNAIQGLTSSQLRYRFGLYSRSIQDYLSELVNGEVNFQTELKNGMAQPINSRYRNLLKYNDEAIANLRDMTILPKIGSSGIKLNKTVDVLITFQSKRQDCVRYVRTSTEDMRDHVFETSMGWVDAYQYVLSLTARTYSIADKIEEIKNSPGFPRTIDYN